MKITQVRYVYSDDVFGKHDSAATAGSAAHVRQRLPVGRPIHKKYNTAQNRGIKPLQAKMPAIPQATRNMKNWRIGLSNRKKCATPLQAYFFHIRASGMAPDWPVHRAGNFPEGSILLKSK